MSDATVWVLAGILLIGCAWGMVVLHRSHKEYEGQMKYDMPKGGTKPELTDDELEELLNKPINAGTIDLDDGELKDG